MPYPPDSGGKNRSFNLLCHLSQQQEVHLHLPSWQPINLPTILEECLASVTVYRIDYKTWKKEHALRIFKRIPHNVASLYTNATLTAFSRTLQYQVPDLIYVDESVVAPYPWPLTHIPSILARQKADHLFHHDVFRKVPFGKEKLIKWIESLLYRSYEYRLWQRFKYGVVVSQEELETFSSFDPSLTAEVIPNGVDVSHFQPTSPLEKGRDEAVLLFHGLMSFYPNIDGATWFVNKVFPLIQQRVPKTKLMIVGQNPDQAIKQLAQPETIIVTGGVPDMREYLAKSQVIVAPIRIGHGTRLKILEALAVGRPIVSTSAGAEGLQIKDGKHLLIADEPHEFAEKVICLLTTPSMSKQLISNGRQLVEKHYSWEAIGRRLNDFCQKWTLSFNHPSIVFSCLA